VFALLAVPAILLAVDMTISYRYIPHPETRDVVVGQTTDDSGQQVDVTKSVYTDTGRSERRRDVLFGAGLFVGGVAALGWSFRQLAKSTYFLVADDDGLLLRVDGIRQPSRRVFWYEIAEVRSGVIEDDGIDTEVFSIRFADEMAVPPYPAGGVPEPPWLHLYSDEWDIPAHQVAALIDHMVTPTAERPPPSVDDAAEVAPPPPEDPT
jgi:hypothetical protein